MGEEYSPKLIKCPICKKESKTGLQAATRETLEETGLNILGYRGKMRMLGTYNCPNGKKQITTVCSCHKEPKPENYSTESNSLEWWNGFRFIWGSCYVIT